MATSITQEGAKLTAAAPSSSIWARFDLWSVCAIVAAALFVAAAFLPLWHMALIAPQYPDNLTLTAYGTTMKGDLQEINSLNHYAGVKEIHPDEVLELTLFPFLLAGSVALMLAAAVFKHRLVRWAAMLVAWGFVIGFLVDIQYWLYNYGHDLNEEAPLYPGPFTPKVLGSTQVVNFHSECMVDWGWWLMLSGALIITLGSPVIRFLRESWSNTGAAKAVPTAAVMLFVLAFAFAGQPGPVAAADGAGDLQAMIDAAPTGSTLTVQPGVYLGGVVIDKPLTVEGVGWPVIDGQLHGDVVKITAEGVTLRGLVIQGSGREVSNEPSGILVRASNALIENNRVRDVLYGITLQESDNHVVRGNEIESVREFLPERRGHALYLYYTKHNLLEDNVISNAKDGIYINFSEHNDVFRNTVTDLRYGIHFMYANQNRMIDNVFRDNLTGGSLMYSNDLYFEGNEFSHNMSKASGYGLLFKDVDNVEMVRNSFHHNRVGLTLEGAPFTPGAYVRLSDNLIGYNQLAIAMSTTVGAQFGGNTFVGNLRQADTTGGSIEHHNMWQIDGRGNYWDDYRGYDANGDGLGDIEYQYRAAYGELVQRNESLKAFANTPAQLAIDLAARWFPAYRNAPAVVDVSPLMRPTRHLSESSAPDNRWAATLSLAILTLLPAAVLGVSGRTRKGW